jgi:hypothetical protein
VDIENNRFINGPSTVPAIIVGFAGGPIIDNTITGYGTGIEVTFFISGADIQDNRISYVHGDGIQIGGAP